MAALLLRTNIARNAHASLPFSQRKNPLSDKFERPELSQPSLAPFKIELVLGIDFPLPPLVSHFMNELPRGVYDGAAVSVDGVIEILRLGPLNAPVETDADRERRGAKRKLGEATGARVFPRNSSE